MAFLGIDEASETAHGGEFILKKVFFSVIAGSNKL